jgi:hypothetical protein
MKHRFDWIGGRERLKYSGGYGCVEGNHLGKELVWFGGMIKVIGEMLRGMVWFGW